MISVLLADDNVIALEHFKNLVDWDSLGFHLAGTATNGLEAFRAFQQLQPHLVITDVQMPGMNGLELARRIQSVAPDTMIVFLSSYDEFDYARTAMSLKAQDYILKHELSREILTEKLSAIRNILEKKNTRSYELLDFQIYMLFHASAEDLHAVLHQSSIPADGDFHFFILEQDHVPPPVASLIGHQIPEADYKTVLPSILAEAPEELHLVRYMPYRWVGVHLAGTANRSIPQDIKSLAEKYAGCSFTLYLFPARGSLLDCRRNYEKKSFLFEQKYFEHLGSTLYTELYEPPASDSVVKNTQTDLTNPLTDGIDAFDRQLQRKVMAYDFNGAINMLCNGILSLQSSIRDNHLSFPLFDGETDQLLTIRRCIRWFKQKTDQLREILNPTYSDTINRAMYYISQHYSNPFLGLEEIAQASGISVNRLNEAFKRELHETIGRHLTKVRMEKARELLKNADIRIQEAAQQSGYGSASYFAHVFGKTWGMTPQAYQKKYGSR